MTALNLVVDNDQRGDVHFFSSIFATARVAPEKADFRPALLSLPHAGLLPEKAMAKTYWEKLKDPRWQRRRLEIMSKAEFRCQDCMDEKNTLNVHHTIYRKGADPWEYGDIELMCLCEPCHEARTGYRNAIDELLQHCDAFEYPDIHALVSGFLSRFVQSEGFSAEVSDGSLFPGDSCSHAYWCGMLVVDLGDFSVQEIKNIRRLLLEIGPDGFAALIIGKDIGGRG